METGRRGYAVLLGVTFVTLLFSALLADPNRVYSRAGARLTAMGQVQRTEGSLYPERQATELHARQLEYRAAEVRRSGDPEYFQSRFTSYILVLLALLAGLATVESLKPEWQDYHKNE